MKITIWSLKGGVGKTSIALNLALSCNCKIITNERYSILSNILSDKEFLQLELNENPPKFKKEENVIFDMGGRADKRIVDCLKQSDFIIIPTMANDIDIMGCISTLSEIEGYIEKEKIVVVINNIKNKYNSKNAQSIITQIGGHRYAFFDIKHSRGLINIFKKKKSINDLVNEGGLNKRHYKTLNEQFDSLIKYIGV